MSNWSADRARYGSGAAMWLHQPALWAIAVYRFGRWTLTAPILIRRPGHVLYFAGYSVVRLVTGIDIPRVTQIGGGLMIHHFGGIVINPGARIGEGCTMRQGVTVGKKHDDGPCPTLGRHVTIGAYAQILGGVTVGDGAIIGAMAVVLNDVPAGATVVGSPAREVIPSTRGVTL